MRTRVLRIVHLVNLPKVACHHALGPEHSTAHRLTAGGTLMVVGVVLAKSAHSIIFPGSEIVLDLVGYAVHGLGCAPYIEWLLASEKGNDEYPYASVGF